MRAESAGAGGSPDPARYPVILFDLDHTLFDFEASKRAAFAHVVEAEGFGPRADELRATLTAVETPLWRSLERGELTLETLNEARFSRMAAAAGIDADTSRMAATYLQQLARQGGLLPGARDLLDALAGRHRLGLVTNGYGEVQRTRMENFSIGHYFEAVVISGEIGVAKPDPRFFDEAFDQLRHPERSSVLVVGDSLTSDMAGGINSGLATCWFNPHGKPTPDHMDIDHIIDDLAAVEDIAA